MEKGKQEKEERKTKEQEWNKETERKKNKKKGNKKEIGNGNLLSFLLRCGTRPYERGTQWDSNSLV